MEEFSQMIAAELKLPAHRIVIHSNCSREAAIPFHQPLP